MKFHSEGPSIPDLLLERCDAGRVVFLCGAGVSVPSGMPNFIDLTKYVVEFIDPPHDSEIMRAFRPWVNGQSESATNIPLDQIFNLLHLEYGKDEINALVTERLSKGLESRRVAYEHDLIKRISASQNGIPQIVTTNFDRLFEIDKDENILTQHLPPDFPELTFGSKIEGITYLHGRLVDANSKTHPYVLSSADFGRAYLSEGWATKFIRNLLEKYTVVLLGYKAEDPPVKYLLQGLNHDGQYDRSKIYAFDRGLPEKIEANWRDRGVTAIAYSKHLDLWQSIEAWAVRADNPRAWRATIIAKSQQDPKNLAPYERGQVAHVLRTVQGARLFSEAIPVPHPEWICVMDANVRSANQSCSYGDDPDIFEPQEVYGLDDDIKDLSGEDRGRAVTNDNILTWRDADDNPHDFHQLGSQQYKGFESTPLRLGHIMNWISISIKSPVIAWWTIKQKGLHPRLLQQLKLKVENAQDLNSFARKTWNLIFEYHNDPRSFQWNGEFFSFKKRIEIEGWTSSTLRDFRKITTPRLTIALPNGLGKSKPPSTTWEEIKFSDLGHWEVVTIEKHHEDLEIPELFLRQAFGILVEQVSAALGMLEDIENSYINMPTFYPERNAIEKSHLDTVSELMKWLVEIFDKVALLWPEFASSHSKTWPKNNCIFFSKLNIYALNKVNNFDQKYALEEILSLDSMTFWNSHLTREILFLLVDRWSEFSYKNQNKLFGLILQGPPKPEHWGNEDFNEIRYRYAAKYGRYLELNGCRLTANHSKRLSNIIKSIPEWSDDWAKSILFEDGHQVQWIATDESPDNLLKLPDSEVIAKAKEELSNDFRSFVDKRSFNGLVKSNPRKALSALKIEARNREYPVGLWAAMINEIRDDASPRLIKALSNRISNLPYSIVAELGNSLSSWLKNNLSALITSDFNLGLRVFDHICNGILSGGKKSVKSNIGEFSISGRVIKKSRRTYDHAINSPIGRCVMAIFNLATEKDYNADSLIPKHIKFRLEQLLSTSGEALDHTVAIIMINLDWIFYVDPIWAETKLISMLEFESPSSEPAWNGFLHSQNRPASRLTEIIKPLILKITPWIENFSWDRDLSMVAAQWIGSMRFLYPDLPHGLSRLEMRSILREMSDDSRNNFISLLAYTGRQNESGWLKYVIPLIEQDWPREHLYRTSASIRAWIGMLDDTDDSFPKVYNAVKKFLVPVEVHEYPFYMFTHKNGNAKTIIERFPEEMLDLIHTITPNFLRRTSHEIPKLLGLITEYQPNLISDIRYLRLIDLVERR